ncbi:hypothetical protein LTR94_029777, partial [Friedmanniomyces endolithicus]
AGKPAWTGTPNPRSGAYKLRDRLLDQRRAKVSVRRLGVSRMQVADACVLDVTARRASIRVNVRGDDRTEAVANDHDRALDTGEGIRKGPLDAVVVGLPGEIGVRFLHEGAREQAKQYAIDKPQSSERKLNTGRRSTSIHYHSP